MSGAVDVLYVQLEADVQGAVNQIQQALGQIRNSGLSAGQATGDALGRGIGDGAQGAMAAVQAVIERAQGQIRQTLGQAGQQGGEALGSGLESGAREGAQAATTQVERSLEGLRQTLAQVGTQAGDALGEGLQSSARQAAQGAVTQVQQNLGGLRQALGQVGDQAGDALGDGLQSGARQAGQQAATQVERGLSTVENAAQDSGSAAGSGFSTSLKVGLAAAFASIAAVTAALAGIGKVSFGVAGDLQESQRRIQAELGVTAQEAQRLAGVAKKTFGDTWGESIDDTTTSIISLRRTLGDISDQELAKVAAGAHAIADNFDKEVPEVASAVKTLMDNFGLTSKQALDFVAKGFQVGLNRADDFLDTIGEYSTQFASNGSSAEKFFSTLESGLGGAVLGTDKVADAFKEFGLRIQSGDAKVSESLQKLGVDSQKLTRMMSSGQVTVQEAWDLIEEKLKNVQDRTLKMQLGPAILGTQYEDLGIKMADGINSGLRSMKDLEGATDSLNVKYDTMGKAVEGMKRQAILALAPVGAELLKIANEAMPMVQSAFDWFKTNMPGIIRGAIDIIKNVSSVIANIYDVAKPVLDKVGQLLSDAFKGGQNLAQNFKDYMPTVVTAIATVGAALLAVKTQAIATWATTTAASTAAFFTTTMPAAIGVARTALAGLSAFNPFGAAILAIGAFALALQKMADDTRAIYAKIGADEAELQGQIDGRIKQLQGGDAADQLTARILRLSDYRAGAVAQGLDTTWVDRRIAELRAERDKAMAERKTLQKATAEAAGTTPAAPAAKPGTAPPTVSSTPTQKGAPAPTGQGLFNALAGQPGYVKTQNYGANAHLSDYHNAIKTPSGRMDGHNGVDIVVTGDKILAPFVGKIETGFNQWLGHFVKIIDAEGKKLVLGHFVKDSIQVKNGDIVQPGQLLGTQGNSGNIFNKNGPGKGIHLHVGAEDARGNTLNPLQANFVGMGAGASTSALGASTKLVPQVAKSIDALVPKARSLLAAVEATAKLGPGAQRGPEEALQKFIASSKEAEAAVKWAEKNPLVKLAPPIMALIPQAQKLADALKLAQKSGDLDKIAKAERDLKAFAGTSDNAARAVAEVTKTTQKSALQIYNEGRALAQFAKNLEGYNRSALVALRQQKLDQGNIEAVKLIDAALEKLTGKEKEAATKSKEASTARGKAAQELAAAYVKLRQEGEAAAKAGTFDAKKFAQDYDTLDKQVKKAGLSLDQFGGSRGKIEIVATSFQAISDAVKKGQGDREAYSKWTRDTIGLLGQMDDKNLQWVIGQAKAHRNLELLGPAQEEAQRRTKAHGDEVARLKKAYQDFTASADAASKLGKFDPKGFATGLQTLDADSKKAGVSLAELGDARSDIESLGAGFEYVSKSISDLLSRLDQLSPEELDSYRSEALAGGEMELADTLDAEVTRRSEAQQQAADSLVDSYRTMGEAAQTAAEDGTLNFEELRSKVAEVDKQAKDLGITIDDQGNFTAPLWFTDQLAQVQDARSAVTGLADDFKLTSDEVSRYNQQTENTIKALGTMSAARLKEVAQQATLERNTKLLGAVQDEVARRNSATAQDQEDWADEQNGNITALTERLRKLWREAEQAAPKGLFDSGKFRQELADFDADVKNLGLGPEWFGDLRTGMESLITDLDRVSEAAKMIASLGSVSIAGLYDYQDDPEHQSPEKQNAITAELQKRTDAQTQAAETLRSKYQEVFEWADKAAQEGTFNLDEFKAKIARVDGEARGLGITLDEAGNFQGEMWLGELLAPLSESRGDVEALADGFKSVSDSVVAGKKDLEQYNQQTEDTIAALGDMTVATLQSVAAQATAEGNRKLLNAVWKETSRRAEEQSKSVKGLRQSYLDLFEGAQKASEAGTFDPGEFDRQWAALDERLNELGITVDDLGQIESPMFFDDSLAQIQEARDKLIGVAGGFKIVSDAAEEAATTIAGLGEMSAAELQTAASDAVDAQDRRLYNAVRDEATKRTESLRDAYAELIKAAKSAADAGTFDPEDFQAKLAELDSRAEELGISFDGVGNAAGGILNTAAALAQLGDARGNVAELRRSLEGLSLDVSGGKINDADVQKYVQDTIAKLPTLSDADLANLVGETVANAAEDVSVAVKDALLDLLDHLNTEVNRRVDEASRQAQDASVRDANYVEGELEGPLPARNMSSDQGEQRGVMGDNLQGGPDQFDFAPENRDQIFQGLSNESRDFLENLKKGWEDAGKSATPLYQLLLEVIAALDEIDQQRDLGATAALEEMQAAGVDTSKAIENIGQDKGIFTQLSGGLQEFASGLQDLSKFPWERVTTPDLNNWLNKLVADGKQDSAEYKAVLAEMEKRIEESQNRIGGLLSKGASIIAKSGNAWSSALAGAMDGIAAYIKSGKVEDAISGLISNIEGLFEGASDTGKKVIGIFVDTVKGVLSSLSKGDWIGAIVAGVAGLVSGIIAVFDGGAESIRKAAQKIEGIIKDLNSSFREGFQLIDLSKIVQSVDNAAQWEKWLGIKNIQVVVDEAALGIAKTLTGGVVKGLQDGIKAGLSGGSIVDGLKAGVRSALEQAFVEALIKNVVLEGALGDVMTKITLALRAGQFDKASELVGTIGPILNNLATNLQPIVSQFGAALDGFYKPSKGSEPAKDPISTDVDFATPQGKNQLAYDQGLITFKQYQDEKLRLALAANKEAMDKELAAANLTAEQIKAIKDKYATLDAQAQQGYIKALQDKAQSDLDSQLSKGLLTRREYADATLALQREMLKTQMDLELSVAGLTDEQKQAIQDKYAARDLIAQQNHATSVKAIWSDAADSIYKGFRDAFGKGLKDALSKGSFATFKADLKKALGDVILDAVLTAVLENLLIAQIVQPAINAFIAALQTTDPNDDAAALAGLNTAVDGAIDAGKRIFDQLAPLAQRLGLGSTSSSDAGKSDSGITLTGGWTRELGAELKSALDKMADALLSVTPRWEALFSGGLAGINLGVTARWDSIPPPMLNVNTTALQTSIGAPVTQFGTHVSEFGTHVRAFGDYLRSAPSPSSTPIRQPITPMSRRI